MRQKRKSSQASRLNAFKYIETLCNPVRLHQMLGYVSLNQYEAEYTPAQAA